MTSRSTASADPPPGNPRYAVVIVNWNGADDTIACLDSFLRASPDAVAIVVDNGSADDSPARIGSALTGRSVRCRRIERDQPPPADIERALLIAAGENLGFAAGCNLGLRAAASLGLTVSVFLNNDTIVEGRALDLIVQRLIASTDAYATLPMLVVDATDRIWNCGGDLIAVGLRRYHLAGRSRSEGATQVEIACSFFTGCCFAIRTADFMSRNGFSERFFFGEEDFELALWMKDRGLTAICLTSAVVRHKVSASFNRASSSGSAKVFIYYLNRYTHMRLRLGNVRWCLWVLAYLPLTIAVLLRNRVVGLAELPAFIARLLGRAATMRGVTRRDFEVLMQPKKSSAIDRHG